MELSVVARAIGELQMSYAMLLSTLIPLAYVATGVLVAPTPNLNGASTALVRTLRMVVLLLLLLVLDACRGHAHAAHCEISLMNEPIFEL